jgi:hypothetical protein
MSISVSRAVPALLLSALLSGGTVALAAPAHADRWTYDDAVGDVTHMIETPTSMSIETVPEQTNGDVTQVAVDHRRTKVVIELYTRARITGAFGINAVVRTPGQHYMLMSFRMPGMGGTQLMTLSDEPDRRCTGLKRKLIADKTAVRLTVPRSCIGDPRWVRVGATLSTFGLFTGEGYDDDALRTASPLFGKTAMSPKIRR